jgi:hypothetical protein
MMMLMQGRLGCGIGENKSAARNFRPVSLNGGSYLKSTG